MRPSSILIYSVIAALAGFLFGFDTVVISGADLALQSLWPRGDFFHGFVVMASALWGTVIGAMAGNFPTDRWGRKKTLVIIGVLYLLSAMGSALSRDPWTFAFFRFIGGLAIGISTIAAPAYISEIAPSGRRGKLVALYQLNIVLGILVAFLSNFLLSGLGENAWRWMLGVEALPALLYTLMAGRIPESPRWLLIRKGNRTEAARILSHIDPSADVKTQIDTILNTGQANQQDSIFRSAHRFPLMLAFFMAFFNQLSGINAFLYYAPRIFELAGLEKSSALLSSAGIGLINLMFTFIGMYYIDRLGRKQLMYIGSAGYILSLSLVALAFFLGWQGMAVPGFLFLFIAAHAIGQGTVIWVFIAEIFPTSLRADGQAFGSSVHWILAAIIPAMMPWLIRSWGIEWVFTFFAGMMVLQLLFVWRMMPETKGVPLEEIGQRFGS